ncbi:MAG: FAD-dependent oxidoreductase [Alphaproteobacteria bacterium]|nr:FAD-dependent oxidoreductase [Alphaproteobacteria bacterium]
MDPRGRGRASRIVRRQDGPATRLRCDIAVLGAGIAGVSAALEAARLGRKVALIDAAPQLGGQSVASVIGTFCGLYSNGPEPYQVTHGIADGILRDLGAEGALHPIRGRRNTIIVQYREQALGRWIERQVAAEGVMPVLSALLVSVRREARRIRGLDLATRFGMLEVEADGFVDASGDAALAWTAGLPCREPQEPIFGTQMLVIEGFDEEALAKLDRAELQARLASKAARHGLLRHDGFVFATPGKGTALVNMTHAETPLDPVGLAQAQAAGREQGDRLLEFLRAEYPAAFGAARVRTYGQIGIRQTRWIVGRHHLTVDEVRQGYRHPDAIGRCSWPIELHDRADGVYWEEFGDGHIHWVPLGAMIPPDIDNLVAAGRCIDGDPAGLSSVRVMGPCIAMGAAAAHALDLAGSGAVAQIDIGRLQARLHDNLERRD